MYLDKVNFNRTEFKIVMSVDNNYFEEKYFLNKIFGKKMYEIKKWESQRQCQFLIWFDSPAQLELTLTCRPIKKLYK